MKRQVLYIVDIEDKVIYRMKDIDAQTASRLYKFCQLENLNYEFLYARKSAEELSRDVGYPIEEADDYV